MSGEARATYPFIGALMDELARAGVRHVCACPGSRSTPLALTAARHPALRLWMHLDERTAGFFALGMARLLRQPVALVCTSGTAAANFLPPVVEARYGRVPLVLLTADRPREVRDFGAPQTIDQVHLYGTYAKWFVDLARPEASPPMLRYARAVAARAAAVARAAPAGPVHVNVPLREPLVPASDEAPGPAAATPEAGQAPPGVRAHAPVRAPSAGAVRALAERLANTTRALVVCGPQADGELAPPLVRLASRIAAPVLADPLSGVRSGHHERALVVDAYDAFLRDRTLAARLRPELILRVGGVPVSKPLHRFLERHGDCHQVLVDGGAGWNDPFHTASEVIHADAAALCGALADLLPGASGGASAGEGGGSREWCRTWQHANRSARRAMRLALEGLTEPFEGRVFHELADLLPEGALLWVGNSMPVRDLDAFFPSTGRRLRLLGNRGASGIDGVVASALGAAAVGDGPALLVLGDLSFYHGMNGLLAARQHGIEAVIVVLHNDGGGIFSFLPQAESPEHFEELFGTPHGLDFRPVAELYGARYARVGDWDGFRAAVGRGLQDGGLDIVEVRTERAANAAAHHRIWAEVSRALQAEGAAASGKGVST